MLLTGFGSVNVSAAENLIDPNLQNWERNDSLVYVDSIDDYYRLRIHVTDGEHVNVCVGAIYDLTSLKPGHSYSLDFYTLLPSELGYSDERIYNQFGDSGFLLIGLASYLPDSDSFEFVDDCAVAITNDNYSNYFGHNTSISFTMPNIVNPCICIMYVDAATSLAAIFGFKNFSLIDVTEEDEDNFLSKIFNWFQEKFDAIGDSFSNLGNKLSTGFTNLGDRIKTFFSDLGTSISNGLNSVNEGIQNKLEEVKTSLVELREGLINGIKGLFIPDDDFISGWKSRIELLLQEHLGIVWEAANFFTDLFSTVSDLLSDTENGSLEFTFPGVEFELLGHNFDLWEERVVDMSFLETDSFWSFWYGLYKIILVIILCFALVLYGYNTLEGKLRR